MESWLGIQLDPRSQLSWLKEEAEKQENSTPSRISKLRRPAHLSGLSWGCVPSRGDNLAGSTFSLLVVPATHSCCELKQVSWTLCFSFLTCKIKKIVVLPSWDCWEEYCVNICKVLSTMSDSKYSVNGSCYWRDECFSDLSLTIKHSYHINNSPFLSLCSLSPFQITWLS